VVEGGKSPERYEIYLSPQAERFLNRQRDKAVKGRIERLIETLAKEKLRPVAVQRRHLKAEHHCRYRVFAGEWRVIYEREGATLNILRIGHRSEVYK